jgi:hypothetical protein
MERRVPPRQNEGVVTMELRWQRVSAQQGSKIVPRGRWAGRSNNGSGGHAAPFPVFRPKGSTQKWSASGGHLCPTGFRRSLHHESGAVDLDLFTGYRRTQSRRHFSWYHAAQAMGVDSSSHAWPWRETLYAYSPQAVIDRRLQKVVPGSGNDRVLATPCSRKAGW